MNERKIEGIRDLRNESAGDTARLVVELRKDANANVVLNQLYKHTPMQTSFSANMLALVDGVPMVLSLDRGAPRLRQAPAGRRQASDRVPAEARQGARAHRRGPREGARHDRQGHRADPQGGRRRRRPCGADEEAVRLQRDPGQLHPRHAAAPPHPARGQEAARRAEGAPGDDQGARVDPEEQDEAQQGRQGRAARAARASTPTSAARSSPPTSARSTCST